VQQLLELTATGDARLECGLSLRDHMTSALTSLHWLPDKQRIEFKLGLLVHQTIDGRAPAYLNIVVLHQFC